ncbi:MAG TPA: RsmD family RNA methyltransferase [Actinocrinis sp.]
MTRIIGGIAKGRRIVVPGGESTRPTSDRAREGLFSALEAATAGLRAEVGAGETGEADEADEASDASGGLAGLRLIDLYAGSGAVGLEALSRGAAAVLLVESGRAAAKAVRANLGLLASAGLDGGQLVVDRAEKLAAGPCPDKPYDVVFLDPPYALPAADLAGVLRNLAGNGWLAERAIAAVERATRSEPWQWPADFRADRSRAYGEGTVWYGRRTG